METKFNFKSQIATSRVQSERLLSLGLKKETADMCLAYKTHDIDGTEIPPEYLGLCEWHGEEERQTVLFSKQKFIPAWSLHRLIELVAADDMSEYMLFLPDVYDEVIAEIEVCIKNGWFNKEYLEE